MSRVSIVDLYESLAVGEQAGVIWSLKQEGDLNVNLVRFPVGKGVNEHVNEDVDVLVIGMSGSGIVTIDGAEHSLSVGTIASIPKGTQRSTKSTSDDFVYLTIHRRRGPLQIGRR